MTINHLNRIFSRHADALRRVSDNGDSIASDAALLSLALALDELATAMQQDNADADDQLARIKRVLAAHDHAWFADVTSGRTPLATAIDALIIADRAALAALTGDMMQANADLITLRAELESDIEPLARWLLEHAPELYSDPATSITEAVLIALEQGRQAQHNCALAEAQSAQHYTDSAKLTQELATLRSWVTAPAGDGKSDPMSANVAAIIQKPAVDSLSQAASDYWIGLDAGRWSWRSVPRSVQLEMVRHVIAGIVAAIDGDKAILTNSRRLWSWKAAKGVALSGVAQFGIVGGKIDAANPEIYLTGVIEVIPCTDAAKESIQNG